MRHFDLNDLRLILSIAEHGSLSRAAAAFPIALSAASNRLRQVEERLGLPLFVRHADGMTPTVAGRLALDHARRVLNEADALESTMNGLRGQARVVLRLAANTVANSTFLPVALGPFLTRFQLVDLQIDELSSRDIAAAVRAGEVDMGVLDGNVATEGLTSLPFRQDRLVLFVPAAHRLAAAGHCRFQEVAGEAFVGLPEARAMQRFVEGMARLAGKAMTVRVRAPSFFAIAQLVSQGVGVAVLPEAAAIRHRSSLAGAIVEIEDSWATRELRLCLRAPDDLGPEARALVAHLTGASPL